jgi:hypothetical protein
LARFFLLGVPPGVPTGVLFLMPETMMVMMMIMYSEIRKARGRRCKVRSIYIERVGGREERQRLVYSSSSSPS